MHLRSVDLNLLVILDALLDEAHVTRAAVRLGLSQPATSSALDRCRALFGDPLLERSGAGMRLTHRAEALRAPLRAVLEETRDLLAPVDIPLDQLRQTVRFVVDDFTTGFLAPPLVARLWETAPGIDLVFESWRSSENALEALERGDADLALSVFPRVEPDFRRELLGEQTYVVSMRRDHPAARGFDLDRWLAWPHVLVSGTGQTRGALDAALARLDRVRRVAVTVPGFALVPPLLAATDLISMLPSGVAATLGHAHGLVFFPPPISVEGFPLHLAWHRRRAHDPAIVHVADLVRELTQELFARAGPSSAPAARPAHPG
ncbi:LysR family transcriptional regulator [Brevundimonas sp.]|uniref:LysR substrate-binding domain-containing protein n=1 Tax=Brevundimonas sp. TaxID=1871086 RepID=UPI0025BF4572|nr:LysR family transcriptional regulator [Brevundimonas sp.]